MQNTAEVVSRKTVVHSRTIEQKCGTVEELGLNSNDFSGPMDDCPIKNGELMLQTDVMFLRL